MREIAEFGFVRSFIKLCAHLHKGLSQLYLPQTKDFIAFLIRVRSKHIQFTATAIQEPMFTSLAFL